MNTRRDWISEGYVTKFAPQKALKKLFARGKLSFDEKVALVFIVWQTRMLADVRELHLTQYIN